MLDATSKQAVLSTQQLIADERGQEVEMRLSLGGGALDADLEHVGHARQAQLAKRAVDFDEVHGVSPWLRRMTRSRYWVRSRISGSIWRSPIGVVGWRSR